MSKIKAVLEHLIKKVKEAESADRILLAGLFTGIVFLLFAFIQIIIINVSNVHVYFDNILLIITDFAVAILSGIIVFRQGQKTGRLKWAKWPNLREAIVHRFSWQTKLNSKKNKTS